MSATEAGKVGGERPTHLDLFSGIGGFALAAQWAGFRTIGFCEIEPFCQRVLAHHWPETQNFEDIKTANFRELGAIDLLTGGFPCQPFSVAGKQRGKDDNRYLWPAMLSAIESVRPTWIVGENVTGIIGMVLDEILSDLEMRGYQCQALVISACAVGAIHKRQRVWILAHSASNRLQGKLRQNSSNEARASKALPPYKVPGGEEQLPAPFTVRSLNGIPSAASRIRAAGNAIVPQVAFQILKEIRKFC